MACIYGLYNMNRNTLCPDVIMRCMLCMCASNVDGL